MDPGWLYPGPDSIFEKKNPYPGPIFKKVDTANFKEIDTFINYHDSVFLREAWETCPPRTSGGSAQN